MKRFVIAQTGRSGSLRTAMILQELGIRCGHERVFSSKILNERLAQGSIREARPIDWGDWDGDSSYAAFAFASAWPEDLVVLHQVRAAPVVARSFIAVHASTNRTFPRLIQELGLSDARPPAALEWAALYWRSVNRRIGELGRTHPGPYFRYRVEDLEAEAPGGGTDTLREICQRIGVELADDELRAALQAIPETVNASGVSGDPPGWEEMPDEVVRLGYEYGYDCCPFGPDVLHE